MMTENLINISYKGGDKHFLYDDDRECDKQFYTQYICNTWILSYIFDNQSVPRNLSRDQLTCFCNTWILTCILDIRLYPGYSPVFWISVLWKRHHHHNCISVWLCLKKPSKYYCQEILFFCEGGERVIGGLENFTSQVLPCLNCECFP